MDSEWTSDALDSCSILISPPPMAAMPSHRFITQWADRMDDIDTSKRKKNKIVKHHYERFEKTKEVQEGFDYQSTEVFSPVSLVPIQLSGLPLPIICAAARLLLSSPKTSFSALTLFRK